MKKKILIAEDTPAHWKIIKDTLEEAGYKTTVVEYGDLAIKKAQEQKPDLIILDIIMPKDERSGERLDEGWRVLEILRKDSQTENIPVIVTTVKVDKEIAEKYKVAAFLNKPFDVNDLLAVVKEVLG